MTSNIPAARHNVTLTPAIHARGLGMVYPNGVRALAGVNLDIRRSDFAVVIGSSGAGKSTLLRCVNRLICPTEGQLKLFGEDITAVSGPRLRSVRRRVGMIFQQFNLVRRIGVLENVLVGRLRFNAGLISGCRSLLRLFPAAEKEYAFECLKQVGIAELAFQRADSLSGGQQQRVAIARALAQDPEVFLADEPVASLDPHSAEVVMETLQKIHEQRRIPVLVNLHHIGFARSFGQRILGVSKGHLVLDGGRADLTDDAIAALYGSRLNEAYGEIACA